MGIWIRKNISIFFNSKTKSLITIRHEKWKHVIKLILKKFNQFPQLNIFLFSIIYYNITSNNNTKIVTLISNLINF
jgi:hypothetical protein